MHASCSWFDFPFNPTKFIPFYGDAVYHDYHHYVGRQSQSNFASVFTFCDHIYGTDKVSLLHYNVYMDTIVNGLHSQIHLA